MRKTLLAVGFAVLISMLLTPHYCNPGNWSGPCGMDCFGLLGDHQYHGAGWRPVFVLSWDVEWRAFYAQTAFLALLATMIVNIGWRSGKKNQKATTSEL
ncbi:MAG TPA: hypothetical protein VFQ83_01475 [Candidatus Udaeobacter sp.]|jgi:hypothetical protein|nr:hypothetical protein [Candidatus Udaeobacter sp.]